MTGGSSFNEVFFDDVRIPAGNVIVAKLAAALLTRRTSDLAIAIAGAAGRAWAADDARGDRWAMSVLMAPASRIAGGTTAQPAVTPSGSPLT